MGCAKFPQASKGLHSQVPTTCKSLGQSCGPDERCCPLTGCRFLGSDRGYFCAADFNTTQFDGEGILATTGITIMAIIFVLFFSLFVYWCTKRRMKMNELRSSERGANNNNENGLATDERISIPMERALGRMIMRQINNSSTSNPEPRRQTTRSEGPRRDPPPSYTDVLDDSPELPSYNEALANEYGID
ncbi:Hypothetical predicted protein [Cloeon dipterum]|uniref:Uncharacterized protein n=1 Tax=Cloeon dipterum TaxID=197152 RepID=A0A8S1C0Q5_9INSE|nr:Hypothetical predicted protein [Cloeon dipterum]